MTARMPRMESGIFGEPWARVRSQLRRQRFGPFMRQCRGWTGQDSFTETGASSLNHLPAVKLGECTRRRLAASLRTDECCAGCQGQVRLRAAGHNAPRYFGRTKPKRWDKQWRCGKGPLVLP